MKRCKKCAEKIQDKAVVCRYCGAEQPACPSKLPTLGVAAGILFVIYVASLFGDKPKPAATEVASKRPEIPGEKCKGFHGEARNFAGLVKQRLRNPDSFEHVQTSYGPVENGVMLATMQYRGTNGFGAVDTKVATGQVMVWDCSARVVTTE